MYSEFGSFFGRYRDVSLDLLVSRYARYYIVFRRDDYLYVNPHSALPTRQIREHNLEPLLRPFHGHAAVRLADGELVDDVLLLGLHLP